MRRLLIGIIFLFSCSFVYSQTSYLPVDSLFRSETPSNSNNDRLYELGTEFQTLSNGYITHARLFSNVNEGGDHIIRLWELTGSLYTLVAGPFTWNFSAGLAGWRKFKFASPIAVDENNTYIISITNGPDMNYEKDGNFTQYTLNSYIRYRRGVYTLNMGTTPATTYLNTCYFRDVVFAINIGSQTPGLIGSSQSLCYNTVPAPLTDIAAPTGGTGVYSYQWQCSIDNSTWTNIDGATSPGYSPPALTVSTYYRRTVGSGSYSPVHSTSVLISVFTLAQLHDNATIYNNTSTNISVVMAGGSSSYTVNYTRDGIAQSPINNYTSGSSISTGFLTTGSYMYSLTSVTDANGCAAHVLGTDITISVLPDQVVLTNKALLIVNSSSVYFDDYSNYIKPYLDNFGIPYQECDLNTSSLPVLSNYAIIIFGHKNVYSEGYPISKLESAVSGGAGLYSFDPHLFDYASAFNTLITQNTVSSSQISISNCTNYITQNHVPDVYNAANNSVNLLNLWTVDQNSNLTGGVDLATMNSGGQKVSLLQVSNYGNGRIVKWSGYDWVFENILGPVYGMDDLIWRGIVWAARKPFAMKGLPPFITMRVDDVNGSAGGVIKNFEWIKTANDFGIIPWCGTFNSEIQTNYIPTLRSLINNNKATASPHAFRSDDFIYFNHYNLPLFDAAANTRNARDFYIQNGLMISKFFVPHFYEINSPALSEIKAMGGEFIGIHMLPDQSYFSDPVPMWINCAPYRINRNGLANSDKRPVYYGGNVNLNGNQFFNCVTEIRDDGGYEWYPDNDVINTTARGVRQLRRALNSMVLSTLFSHEYYFGNISSANWREILRRITSSIAGYSPEYVSMDYAVQYIRARNNIRIIDVQEKSSTTEISCSGTNDLDTKCYLFTEQLGQITYQFVTLPQINGNEKVIINKSISTILPEDNLVKIKVYPNPCNEVLTLSIPAETEYSNMSVSIYNSSGQVVVQKKLDNGSGITPFTIGTSEFKNGYYFMRIVSATKTNTFKFVILH